jgi:serpin B
VPAFDPRTVLAIATAIFFKGRWLEAFDPLLTKDHPFRTAGGGEKTLPMMARSEERILYFRTGSIHAVRLLYRGNAFETVIATTVERGDTSIARWIAGASAGEWATVINRVDYASAAVELRLPRQELATEANLRDAVAASPALAPLMEPAAQFGRLTGLAVGIDQVLHKARVRMDEEGTVAAAATALTMIRVSGRPKPVDFTVDRPHVFLIRHMPTGAVVFAGYVADPMPLPAPAG